MAVRVDEARKQHAVAEVVDRTVGRAGSVATTEPDDATTGDGNETVADRGTRDRKQPAGAD
jgi:hypothetical protein